MNPTPTKKKTDYLFNIEKFVVGAMAKTQNSDGNEEERSCVTGRVTRLLRYILVLFGKSLLTISNIDRNRAVNFSDNIISK